MGERGYRRLQRTAVALTLAWIGWTLYDSSLEERHPGGHELAAAGKYLEDGQLADALTSFEQAQQLNPDNIGILRGKAQTYMRLGNQQTIEANQLRQTGAIDQADAIQQQAEMALTKALALYNRAIEQEEGAAISNQTALGVSLANRGILKDQMGDYHGALADYQTALELEPKVAEGPGFLTRFLRNQAKQPPTVADRARYLEHELAKPETERLLKISELDAKQRAYKMD